MINFHSPTGKVAEEGKEGLPLPLPLFLYVFILIFIRHLRGE